MQVCNNNFNNGVIQTLIFLMTSRPTLVQPFKFQIWNSKLISMCDGGKYAVVSNEHWNSNLNQGQLISGDFIAHHSDGVWPAPVQITYPYNGPACPSTGGGTPTEEPAGTTEEPVFTTEGLAGTTVEPNPDGTYFFQLLKL